MQEVEAGAREFDLASIGPLLEAIEQLATSLKHVGSVFPSLNCRLIQLDEDAFAAHLRRRKPVGLQAERRGGHTQIVLALQIGGGGLQPGKPDLYPNLT